MVDAGVWRGSERARLVRLCAAISGDSEVAEDLAQETLLEAWRHRHKLTDARGGDRWLAAIARNVCLRWSRTRNRLPVPVAELPEPAAPAEDDIAELLELLPPDSRDPMVQRYVHDRTHQEIARSLGISSAAVSMRLTRGKQSLRRALSEAEWRPSGSMCPQCGTRKLLMRRTPKEIEFTCVSCARSGMLVRYPLENPQFARLVSGLQRPTAMFRRVGEWAVQYFSGGASAAVPCTRCGRPVVVRAHVREGGNRGLYVRCGGCGEEVWSSLVGIANGLPSVRELRPRRLVQVREERGLIAVVHGSLGGGRTVEVAFDRATYALLGVA
ncbi:MAG TPA: sigma-70 family RNA polymerase sigma factor [Gaiellaceae bacterium]|nr:sigma-70 family RNA polymerase sigma factor [Gaiellaceae bacterium]